MKKNVFVLILAAAFFTVSCEEIKEDKMRKDAIQFIEYSKTSDLIIPSVEFLTFAQAMDDKYKGDDLVKFMSILKEEVKKRVDNGEGAGLMELILIPDELNNKK